MLSLRRRKERKKGYACLAPCLPSLFRDSGQRGDWSSPCYFTESRQRSDWGRGKKNCGEGKV